MVGQDLPWATVRRVRQAATPHAIIVALLSVSNAATSAPIAPAKTTGNSIPFAEHGGIRDWRADGSKGLWIQAAGGRWYYASFSSPCLDLPFARGIRFVAGSNGELSRWSSIRLAQSGRCFFRNLQQSAAPPKVATAPQVRG